jgi:hypothetical protein
MSVMTIFRQVIPEGDKNYLRLFLKEVAWPAMAGNVAWSFFRSRSTLASEGVLFQDLRRY